MLTIEKKSFRLTGISPILGSLPASDAVRTEFIASKAPTDALREEETTELTTERLERQGLTVFATDNEDQLYLFDYVVRGFFKAAIAAASADIGVLSVKSKVDQFLFMSPRRLYLMRGDGRHNGEFIKEVDDIYERPLRAETLRGPRTALAASERIYDPWYIDVTIGLLENKGTAKSKPITWDAVETALDYGEYQGLGQFRNGGFGRFVWRETDKITEE